MGRWFGVDPQNQFASPYTGMGNNPVNGIDPDGELFIIDDFIIGGIKGLFNGEGFWDSGIRHAENSAKIWGGLFATDSNLNFGQRLWQGISRFTWELPQTTVGFFSSHGTNTIGHVNEVDYFGGATVLQTRGEWGAITLGSYIIGDRRIEAEVGNPLFMHEYGHYIQSRKTGWMYFPKYGIPSLLSPNDQPHGQHWTETDANLRGFEYFSEYHGITRFDPIFGRRATDWDEFQFPIALRKTNPKWWNMVYYSQEVIYLVGLRLDY